MKEFSVEGKAAIVTGGARGVGEGISLALAEAGADIVISDMLEEQMQQAAEKVRALGRKCLTIKCDVTDEAQVNAMVDRAAAEFQKIDILVNNVGTTVIKPLITPPGFESGMTRLLPDFDKPMSRAEWQKVFDINLTSAFLCSRAAALYMVKQNSGRIINVSSMGSIRGSAYRVAYTSSKAAVSMFTKSVALEWARYGINVNAVAPGSVETAMTAWLHADPKAKDRLIRSIPLRRLCEPRDIGLAAVFLSSEASSYITGQTIIIAGGSDL